MSWLSLKPRGSSTSLAVGVYLQAENGLVHFTSVNSNGGLRIGLADQIEYHEDLRSDPDVELAAASVGDHYLAASGHPVHCTAMRLFTNRESVPQDGIFRAAEMTLANGSTVFFDPFWIDGIRLGTGNTPDLCWPRTCTARVRQASIALNPASPRIGPFSGAAGPSSRPPMASGRSTSRYSIVTGTRWSW